MNAYQEKLEAKRGRLEAAAERAEAKANADYKRSDLREENSGIPFGQPILVGHHSEKRHRAALARAENAMRASVEADKKAKELRERAASVGTAGISSDDPEAIRLLKEKAAKLQFNQDFMREANKVVRRALKNKVVNKDSNGFEEYRAELAALNDGVMKEASAVALLKPDFAGRIGFASYQLSNNNANLKATQKRIKQLEAARAAEPKDESFEGVCDLVENVDENRIQLKFEGKPSDEVRKLLKSYGFRWAPSQGAWQRQLNNAGRYAASQFLKSQGVAR